MLLEFSVSNFRSIRDEQTLSLLASKALKEHPENLLPDAALPGMKGVRFLRSAAIFGPNASGKSTVLAALPYLRKLLFESRPQKGDPVEIDAFRLGNPPADENTPSVFHILFVAKNGVRFQYGLALCPKRILEEKLTSYPAGKPKNIFHRTWRDETSAYSWDISATIERRGLVNLLSELTEPNTPYAADLARLTIDDEITAGIDWLRDHLRAIDLSLAGSLSDSESTHILKNEPALAHRLLTLVRGADLGIDDIEVRTDEATGKTSIRFRHLKDDGSALHLPLESESAGTLRFFAVIGPLLRALQRGDTVLVDEMETSLHPMMAREIVNLFHDPAINTTGAQLIFTTRNPILLDTDIFRRDQIWFTDKARNGATHLYPLTHYAPRRDEALLRGYAGGRYGALPYMPDGLAAGLKTPAPSAP